MFKSKLTHREVQDLWTKALESGEYKQTKSKLHNIEGFCCLGVLCDLAVKNKVIEAPKLRYDRYEYKDGKVGTSTTYLPKVVTDWAGLQDTGGSFEDKEVSSLMSLNDSKGLSFIEISTVIKARPKGLFVEETLWQKIVYHVKKFVNFGLKH